MSQKLECYQNGLRFENPFLVGSGPPSTNAKVIARSFEAGWGGSVIKTLSLDHSQVRNIAPRYGKHFQSGKCIGFTNNELITDRPIEVWLEEMRELKKQFPTKVLIASIMEGPVKEKWHRLTELVCQAGADMIELNLSCPHGMPELKMGQAMGQCPEIISDVVGWCKEASTVPVWAKMTPNITDVVDPAKAAMDAGADGLTAINTILSMAGIDMKTFKPIPNVKGVSAFGGYSYTAVKPVALRMVGELAMAFPGVEISGVGGIVDGQSAAEFLCMGAGTLQVCTGIMLDGFKMIDKLKAELTGILDEHGMDHLHDLKGKSLEYFGTMREMADRLEASRKQTKAHTNAFGRDNIVVWMFLESSAITDTVQIDFRDTLVIIPTYNEVDNVRGMISALMGGYPGISVLIIDDNSPDGTKDVVEKMRLGEENLNLIVRDGKRGLASAYIAGFKWALARNYRYIFQMDCDFSHDPKQLQDLRMAAETHDLVIGSRYIKGVRIVNWPFHRLLLSYLASLYIRFVTNLPIKDPTGGFKCFRRRALASLDLEQIMSRGYIFQLELSYKLFLGKFKIVEVPIVFHERREGQSKIEGGIIFEAFVAVLKLRFYALLGRLIPMG